MLRIRYWRLKRGLTLQQLDELTGIDYRLLSEYERGKVDPGASKLPAIATALGISVSQLYPRQRKAARPPDSEETS